MVRVALTFDAEHADRPADHGTSARLVRTLGDAGIRATFFLQGRWAQAEPMLARAIAEAGHAIGSHSHYHVPMSLLTEPGLDRDIREAQEAIASATGRDPRPWFRCPFGDGASDARVQAALAAAGYRHVGWHVDPQDWAEGVTGDQIAARVLEGIDRSGDGTVALLHAWTPGASLAVKLIAAAAAGREIELVTIDELGMAPIATVPW